MKTKNAINKNVIYQFAKTLQVDLSLGDFAPTSGGFEDGFGVYVAGGGNLKFKAVGDDAWRTIEVPDYHYPNIACKAIASTANGTTAVVQLAGI